MRKETEIQKFERVFKDYSDRDLDVLMGRRNSLKSLMIKSLTKASSMKTSPEKLKEAVVGLLKKGASPLVEALLFSSYPGLLTGHFIKKEKERALAEEIARQHYVRHKGLSRIADLGGS